MLQTIMVNKLMLLVGILGAFLSLFVDYVYLRQERINQCAASEKNCTLFIDKGTCKVSHNLTICDCRDIGDQNLNFIIQNKILTAVAGARQVGFTSPFTCWTSLSNETCFSLKCNFFDTAETVCALELVTIIVIWFRFLW